MKIRSKKVNCCGVDYSGVKKSTVVEEITQEEKSQML
jgi:hypothetical protein